jgi:hypothetical protein
MSTEKKHVAIITPSFRHFNEWVKENAVEGERYTIVRNIADVFGREFDLIRYGIKHGQVDEDVIEAAKRRLV